MEIRIEGARELAMRFGNSPEAIRKMKQVLFDTSTLMVQGKAKELAPVDTNFLRGSILREVRDTYGKVGTNVEYAKYQEFGTGIYGPKKRMITPIRAKRLAWKDKSGKWIFARAVRGTRPRKFMRGAVDYLSRNMNEVLRIAGNYLIKNL